MGYNAGWDTLQQLLLLALSTRSHPASSPLLNLGGSLWAHCVAPYCSKLQRIVPTRPQIQTMGSLYAMTDFVSLLLFKYGRASMARTDARIPEDACIDTRALSHGCAQTRTRANAHNRTRMRRH